ncbi:MAG: anaerobic ribonucleoside-triphosphate reductase activating protein [Candidatus Glassbacteria bacterium]|nr:anaerobic ribonucleoside-triphosphate reductase activating protein [Candidatus Glassbacteria bacterium]
MNPESGNLIQQQTRQSPVYALLRKPSFIDFPGCLCRVLFVSGCNLRCKFCHNFDLVNPKEKNIEWERLGKILLISRENWIEGVCITGGEPTLHPKLSELILWLKKLGFKVKLDTNGTLPEVLGEVLPLVDYVAMDYKAPLESYPGITDRPGLCLERIAESKELILEWGGDYEFRTTVIEGLHTAQDMRAICRELEGARRYVLQAFVPAPGMDAGNGLPRKRTPIALLRQYHEICREYFEEPILRGG